MHNHHRFHTLTGHFYLSRPIFLHRPAFDAWPARVRSVFAEAVSEAVVWQRGAALAEHEQARLAIERAGGDIITLEQAEREEFVRAVAPLHRDARNVYGNALIACMGR